MKKILLMLTIAVILTCTSCSRQNYSNALLTPMPMIDGDNIHIIAQEDRVPEEAPAETTDISSEAKKSFEKLRTAIYSLMDNGQQGYKTTNLEKMILNHYDDKIIVSSQISPEYVNSFLEDLRSEHGLKPLPDSTDILFVAANEFQLENGKFVNRGIFPMPVLAKRNDSGEIEKVFLPEMQDFAKREEDLQKIFGEYAEYLDIKLFSGECIESYFRVNSIQYQVFLDGGFDDFSNNVIDMLQRFKDNGLLDATTKEGAIFEHFIKKEFSYSTLSIPFWHVLGEGGDEEADIIYADMYVAQFRQSLNNSFNVNGYSTPNRFYIYDRDDKFEVFGFSHFLRYGTKSEETVSEIMDEYNDDYYGYHKSDEYDDFSEFYDKAINSLIDGTFDFENDTLIYSR